MTKDDTLGHKKLAVMLKTGKNRVRRVMKKYDLEARRRKKKYIYPGKASETVDNLLLVEVPPVDVIFSDIFEFSLYDGSKVRGCFALLQETRQILSMAFDYTMRADLVVETINRMDFLPDYPLWHSDQGSQYGSKETVQALIERGFTRSMSRAGTPTDNGYAERFVGIFKHSVCKKQKYYSMGDFLIEAEKWINFYNNERPHEGIDMLTPNKMAEDLGLKVRTYLNVF